MELTHWSPHRLTVSLAEARGHAVPDPCKAHTSRDGMRYPTPTTLASPFYSQPHRTLSLGATGYSKDDCVGYIALREVSVL